MDCPQAVGAVAGSGEDNTLVGSNGDLIGVERDGAAMVAELAD